MALTKEQIDKAAEAQAQKIIDKVAAKHTAKPASKPKPSE